MIYKILHRKQKIGNYEPHKENNGGNSGTPEGYTVSAPLLNDTNIILYGNCVKQQYK